MKKTFLLTSVVVLISFMSVSCGKSPEKQFLEEFEALVTEAEGLSTKEDAQKFIDVTWEKFKARAYAQYGWAHGDDFADEDKTSSPKEVEAHSNLKMSEEQVKKLNELRLRFDSCDDRIEKLIEAEENATEDIALPKVEQHDEVVESISNDSEDWDALLKSYEEYVDKYITLMKKANQGDMDALSEYPALLEKAEEIDKKLEKAQDDMSASQWAKYMKITNKMSTAIQEM